MVPFRYVETLRTTSFVIKIVQHASGGTDTYVAQRDVPSWQDFPYQVLLLMLGRGPPSGHVFHFFRPLRNPQMIYCAEIRAIMSLIWLRLLFGGPGSGFIKRRSGRSFYQEEVRTFASLEEVRTFVLGGGSHQGWVLCIGNFSISATEKCSQMGVVAGVGMLERDVVERRSEQRGSLHLLCGLIMIFCVFVPSVVVNESVTKNRKFFRPSQSPAISLIPNT